MATPDEDLSQLERDVRQLKIEYEQYFGGGRNRPPSDTEWRIELILRRYADRGGELNYAQRFRYNNLAQTYARYREIFRKRLKQKEEGFVPRHFGAAAKAIEAERAARAKQSAPRDDRDRPLGVAFSDPDLESEKVKQLYQAFFKAKLSAGEETERLTLKRFREFLQEKTKHLKKQKGCQQVEYVVTVEDGQVRLKARVKD